MGMLQKRENLIVQETEDQLLNNALRYLKEDGIYRASGQTQRSKARPYLKMISEV